MAFTAPALATAAVNAVAAAEANAAVMEAETAEAKAVAVAAKIIVAVVSMAAAAVRADAVLPASWFGRASDWPCSSHWRDIVFHGAALCTMGRCHCTCVHCWRLACTFRKAYTP